MISRRICLILYLLSLFFVGIGYLAILPPFEGLDEAAHFSSMRQISTAETLPVLGKSVLDRAYSEYEGPKPYLTVEKPFDRDLVYSKFFAQPELVEKYIRLYRDAPATTPFVPGEGINWQAQHPPLYYLLMAPIVYSVGGLSFVAQFFVLRLASFVLALGGIAFGLLAVEKGLKGKQKDAAFVGFFVYPLVLPVFLQNVTRLGNDSLCLFLMGAMAYLLVLWRRDETNIKLSVSLGAVLGLGLLTKALFLPVTAALAGFLFLRLWLDKSYGATKPRRRVALLGMFYPALLMGGAWYLGRLALNGDLSGGIDSVWLAQQGGWITGLREHFSIYALVRSMLATIYSYSWAGTYSYAFLPLALRTPLVVLLVWIFSAFILQIKKKGANDFLWLPVWLFVALSAGLFYDLMMGIATDGMGHTPGWYLHILMPFVAPAMGIGVAGILQKPRARIVMIAALIYAFLFQVVAVWAQFSLFTGCATKPDDEYYAFSSHVFCLDQAATLVGRMSVIGWPTLAALGFGGGVLCALALVLRKTGVLGGAKRR